jgi:pilus assembly protein CpaB
MPLQLPPIHPIRIVAVILLAGAVAFGSYQLLKPHTFAYVKLREGVVVEGGTPLQAEQIEEGVLATGGLFVQEGPPIPGLLAWADAERYVGLPVNKRLHGGVPLFVDDLDQQGEENIDRVLGESMTGMSIPVDNIVGITPHLSVGDRVHLYASFEDEAGAHSGLLLRNMPVISLQRELDGDVPNLVAVTIAVKTDEAVLLTHALHYGKVRLGKASVKDAKPSGIGEPTFASALMRTKKRWSEQEEERR